MGFNNWFRRNQKKVYIVMIFAMGAWGIGTSAIYFIPQKAIGTISGEKVTRDQLADFDTRWRRILLSRVQGPVLDLVWKQMVFERESNRSGIVVTDSDIYTGLQDLSLQIFGGKTNIDNESLVRLMCNTFNVNRNQLLQTIKEVMGIHKLDYFLKRGVKVTTDELWQRYALENEKVKIKLASFEAEDFINTVNVTEDEVKEFYNKYKENFPDISIGTYGYKEPEKVKVEYIMANYNELRKNVNITDEEMLKYYEENKETEFKESEKKGPDVEKGDLDSGTSTAKKESGSESTKFKVFDDVKELIKNKLQNEKSRELANELIVKADDDIYENLDKLERLSFKDIAEKYGLIYKIPESPTAKTEYISQAEAEKLLIGTDRFASIAFEKEKYDPSQPLDALSGKYIFQVVDKLIPTTPPLSEIYEKVKLDLKTDKAFKKAQETAEQCLNKIKVASFKEDYDAFVTEIGSKKHEIGVTDYISRPTITKNRQYGYIASLQMYRPDVVTKAFELKENEIGLAVEEGDKKASYLITIVEKQEAKREEFDNKIDQIRRRYVAEKQRYILSKWEDDIVKKAHLDI